MIWLGPIDLDVECTKLSSAEFRGGLVSEVSEYLLQLPFGYRGRGGLVMSMSSSLNGALTTIDWYMLAICSGQIGCRQQ